MLSSRKISKFKSKNSNSPFFGRILSGKQITLFSCPSVLKKAGSVPTNSTYTYIDIVPFAQLRHSTRESLLLCNCCTTIVRSLYNSFGTQLDTRWFRYRYSAWAHGREEETLRTTRWKQCNLEHARISVNAYDKQQNHLYFRLIDGLSSSRLGARGTD